MPAGDPRAQRANCGSLPRTVRGTAVIAALLQLSGCDEPACVDQPGYVCPLAGTGEYAFNRDGLPATATHLFLVSAARRGPDDRIWLMDFNNQRLRTIEDDDTVATVMGNGFHAIASTGVGPLDTPLENPIDFRFLSGGRLVFVSYHDPRVLELGPDGLLRSIAGADDGIVGVDGNEGDGGPATDALFIQLDGIAVAPDDTIYVSDSLAHRVRMIRNGTIDTVAGTGEPGHAGDGGPGVEAALHWPTALELDRDGNLYIADARNHVVRRLAVDGTIDTIAGTGVPGFAGDGGPARDAQLQQPQGLALAEDGTLYIGTAFAVRRVDPDGTIDTIAGVGRDGDAGDGGPATSARFGYVARVALDGDALLVADQSNSRVRRIGLR
jgi:DNA-binding beta-propeller fold protein YncE